jgi:hypothetical protein
MTNLILLLRHELNRLLFSNPRLVVSYAMLERRVFIDEKLTF